MSTASFSRARARYGARIAFVSLVSLIVLIVVMSVSHALKDAPFRQAYIVTTEPMRVVSYDKQSATLQVVVIPQDILIDGALGYGQYAVSAIKTLDGLDNKHGVLLRESVGQAIGVPIAGAIIVDAKSTNPSHSTVLKEVFSWGSIFRRAIGRVGTSVSWADWTRLVFILHAVGADDVEVLDLSKATSDVLRPDGVTVHLLDPQKVDYILNSTLHDTRLRNENKTITIVNTTTVIGIGSEIARMIGRFGMQVVSVGNESETLERCQLEADKKTKSSYTYQFLRSFFHCDEKIVKEAGDVSDITFRLGTNIASLFEVLPK